MSTRVLYLMTLATILPTLDGQRCIRRAGTSTTTTAGHVSVPAGCFSAIDAQHPFRLCTYSHCLVYQSMNCAAILQAPPPNQWVDNPPQQSAPPAPQQERQLPCLVRRCECSRKMSDGTVSCFRIWSSSG
eukprot:1327684-Amphidinium_carterae.2